MHTSVLAKGLWGCLSASLSQGCVYTVMKWSWESFVKTPEGSFKVKCKFSIVFLLNNVSAIPAFDPVTAVPCVEVNRNLGNTVWCCMISCSKTCEWNCALAGGSAAGMHTQALLEQEVDSALINDFKHKLHNCKSLRQVWLVFGWVKRTLQLMQFDDEYFLTSLCHRQLLYLF